MEILASLGPLQELAKGLRTTSERVGKDPNGFSGKPGYPEAKGVPTQVVIAVEQRSLS
jgi:hypothetical protein